jgi:hypothetical protein
MKVMFLDIDGVLNSVDTAVAFHSLKTEIDYRINEQRLDPVSIGLLKALCDKTDAKIVISSTWRMGRTLQDFINIFASYGWKDFPVIDKTPIGYHLFEIGSRTRGHEIQHWLSEHPEVTKYLIIDDDSDMLDEQMQSFVHVSNINGFRSNHYCHCLRLLGHPNEMLEKQVNWSRRETSNAAAERVLQRLEVMSDEELFERLESCDAILR